MGMVFAPPRVLAGTRLFCVEVPAFVNITMVSIPCDLSVTVTLDTGAVASYSMRTDGTNMFTSWVLGAGASSLGPRTSSVQVITTSTVSQNAIAIDNIEVYP